MKRRLHHRINVVGGDFVPPKAISVKMNTKAAKAAAVKVKKAAAVEDAAAAENGKTTVVVKSPSVKPTASPKNTPKTTPKQSPKAAPQPALKSILKRKRPDDEKDGAVSAKQQQQEEMQLSKRQKKEESRLLREAAAKLEAERERDTLFIAVGTYNSTLGGYNFSTKTGRMAPVFAVKPQAGYVSEVALSDKWMLSASSDDTLSVFSSKRLRSVGSCGSEGTITRMVLREGNVLCTTASGHVMAVRCSDWYTVWKEQGHKKRINDLTLHPSGALGITVGDDAFLKLWNFATCKLLLQVKLPKPATLVQMAPAVDVYFVYAHPDVVLYNMKGEKKASLKLADEAHCCSALSDDTFLFGLENGGFEAVMVSADKIASMFTMEAHRSRVRDMHIAEHKSRKAMVSVCSSGSLVVWECDGTRKPVEVKRMELETRFTCVSAMWK